MEKSGTYKEELSNNFGPQGGRYCSGVKAPLSSPSHCSTVRGQSPACGVRHPQSNKDSGPLPRTRGVGIRVRSGACSTPDLGVDLGAAVAPLLFASSHPSQS